jgi:hypothetical protein
MIQGVDTHMQAGRVDVDAQVRSLAGLTQRWVVDQPLFPDVSSYQGEIDYDAPAMAAAPAVGIRIGVGLVYDRNWKYNWAEAGARGKLRLPYWALTMHQSVRTQADMFHQAIKGEQELPAAWDCERVDGQTKAVITRQTQAALDLTRGAFEEMPILYSAAWWINAYIDPQIFDIRVEEVWYWMAGYLAANPITGYAIEHPGPVTIPAWMDRKRVFIHQTAGKAMGKLAGWGVQSLNIDLNRWVMGAAHLAAFSGHPLPLTLEQQVAVLTRIVFRLEDQAEDITKRVDALESR